MALPDFSDLNLLKAQLLNGAPDLGPIGIAADFEPFNLPLQPGSGVYWRDIEVRLYAYVYAIGDEGSTDEPEFVSLAQIDGITSSQHTPEGFVDPPELKAWEGRYPRQVIAEHHSLYDRAQHSIAVSSAAFDSDQDSAWESFVKALGMDVRDVGGTLIQQLAPGLVSPGRLLDFLAGKLGGILTDSSETIGSEKVILDRNEYWERPPGLLHWRGGKWAVFYRRHQAAWYLTLWTVDLDAGPLARQRTERQPRSDQETDKPDDETRTPPPLPRQDTGQSRPMRPDHARQYLVSSPLDVAAVRVLKGEAPATVAKDLKLKEEVIERHVRWLETDTAMSFDLRVRAALLEEVAKLRQRLNEIG